MNAYHQEILHIIKKRSGKPTQHTFVDSYLGTTHTRYPMNNPTMRTIAKEFIKSHALDESSFTELLSSLIEGKSFTEKSIAGFMLDYAGKRLWTFDPAYFDQWLNHLEGWAEIDTLCTGKYSATVTGESAKWKKLLVLFSKNDRIAKRRASLVFCCRPLGKQRDEQLLNITFQNIKRLESEKDVLITKAISWVLRSAIKYHKAEVNEFVNKNLDTLPKIAVRETLVKLKTGRKTQIK